MHVLKDQDDRRTLADQVQQLEDGFEQPQLTVGIGAIVKRAAVIETGKDRGQLGSAAGAEGVQRRVAGPDQRSQRAQDRRVGKLAVGLLDALAAQDEGLGLLPAELLLELGDQARLAYSGVTAEQDEGGTPGRGLPGGEPQFGQLADPTHDVTARQPCPHERSIA